jgi:hypothetical protein
MWTCPECDSKVSEQNISCDVCGGRRYSNAQSGIRHDLACLLVRGLGLLLLIWVLLGLPNTIAVMATASQVEAASQSSAGSLGPVGMAALFSNVVMFFVGVYLLSNDVLIRVLTRPIRS